MKFQIVRIFIVLFYVLMPSFIYGEEGTPHTESATCERAFNLDAIIKQITENAIVSDEKLWDFYVKSYFKLNKRERNSATMQFRKLISVNKKHAKPVFREQIITVQDVHYSSEVLEQLIYRFQKTANELIYNLSHPAHLNFWRKLLDHNFSVRSSFLSKKDQKAIKKKQEQTFLNNIKNVFLEYQFDNPIILLKNNKKNSAEISDKMNLKTILVQYNILSYFREDMLNKGKNVQKISQVMVDFVGVAGVYHSYNQRLLKDTNIFEKLQGLRNILNERNRLAQLLGFYGGFAELQAVLGVKQSLGFSTSQDILNELNKIEIDIKEREENSLGWPSYRVRALSLQESPFRGCLGRDCSTRLAFTEAFDPRFVYFTLTNRQLNSSGKVQLALGTATNNMGERVLTAFVDKIQNIRTNMLLATLSAIQLSVQEQGYTLAFMPSRYILTHLSDDISISDYVHRKLITQLDEELHQFTPHRKMKYFIKDTFYPWNLWGLSNAFEKMSVLVFKPHEWAGFTIKPGEIHTPKKLSFNGTEKDIFQSVLVLKDSENIPDQIDFIKQIPILESAEIISNEQVKSHLISIIKSNKDFILRKQAWSALAIQNHSVRSMVELLSYFSHSEQGMLIEEIKQWKIQEPNLYYSYINSELFSQFLFKNKDIDFIFRKNFFFIMLLDFNFRLESYLWKIDINKFFDILKTFSLTEQDLIIKELTLWKDSTSDRKKEIINNILYGVESNSLMWKTREPELYFKYKAVWEK